MQRAEGEKLSRTTVRFAGEDSSTLLVTTQTTQRTVFQGSPQDIQEGLRHEITSARLDQFLFKGLGAAVTSFGIKELSEGVLHKKPLRILTGITALSSAKICLEIAKKRGQKSEEAAPVLKALFKAASTDNHAATIATVLRR